MNRSDRHPGAVHPDQDPWPNGYSKPGLAAGSEPGVGKAESAPAASTWVDNDEEPELDFKEYLWLLWARRWIILAVTAIVTLTTWAWTHSRPVKYRTSTTISIDARSPQIIRQSQFLIGPNPWEQAVYIREQERILRSYDLAQRAVVKIGLDAITGDGSESSAVAMLLGMLDVMPLAETTLVTLSMTGSDPDRIAEWLNLYIDEYIAFNIDDSLKQTNQIYEVITEELEPLREQLTESEERLMSFKKRQGSLLSADQDKNVISEQVNKLTTELAEAKAERIRLETKILALEEVASRGLSSTDAPEVLDDRTLLELNRQRNELEAELTKNLQVYREGHPTIKDLRGRIKGIELRIRDQIESVINALRLDFEIMRRREQTLSSSLAQLREESIELSQQTLEYETLKRDYDQIKTFYNGLLARSKEAEISGSISFNRIRVIDRARPAKQPVSPNLTRSVTMGLMIGALLGIGLVLTLNHLDRTLRTPTEIKRRLGLDVFAMVPAQTNVSKRIIREVFQGLRTALMFAAQADTCQVVLVVSAGPGEGKTTTVFNLGKVLAAAGSRVLIIDGDLRKPRIHKILKLPSSDGLTSLVLGERDLSQVVYCIEGTLDVIPCGPLPPNPPAMFGNPAFRRLLESLRQRYDWILLDSAPIISVTDSVVCASVVDMVLLVVEFGHLDHKMIQGAQHQLARAGANVVGAVLNKVDMEKKAYYYDPSYYSYYYGEDEYGENPKEEG
jgi:capsular exopolysaccharide synthesis family protein